MIGHESASVNLYLSQSFLSEVGLSTLLLAKVFRVLAIQTRQAFDVHHADALETLPGDLDLLSHVPRVAAEINYLTEGTKGQRT